RVVVVIVAAIRLTVLLIEEVARVVCDLGVLSEKRRQLRIRLQAGVIRKERGIEREHAGKRWRILLQQLLQPALRLAGVGVVAGDHSERRLAWHRGDSFRPLRSFQSVGATSTCARARLGGRRRGQEKRTENQGPEQGSFHDCYNGWRLPGLT